MHEKHAYRWDEDERLVITFFDLKLKQYNALRSKAGIHRFPLIDVIRLMPIAQYEHHFNTPPIADS